MQSSSNSADLLGLSTPIASSTHSSNANVLVDVLGDLYGGGGSTGSNSLNASQNNYNPKKYTEIHKYILFYF